MNSKYRNPLHCWKVLPEHLCVKFNAPLMDWIALSYLMIRYKTLHMLDGRMESQEFPGLLFFFYICSNNKPFIYKYFWSPVNYNSPGLCTWNLKLLMCTTVGTRKQQIKHWNRDYRLLLPESNTAPACPAGEESSLHLFLKHSNLKCGGWGGDTQHPMIKRINHFAL